MITKTITGTPSNHPIRYLPITSSPAGPRHNFIKHEFDPSTKATPRYERIPCAVIHTAGFRLEFPLVRCLGGQSVRGCRSAGTRMEIFLVLCAVSHSARQAPQVWYPRGEVRPWRPLGIWSASGARLTNTVCSISDTCISVPGVPSSLSSVRCCDRFFPAASAGDWADP